MPKDIVDVQVTAQLAGFPEETFGATVVVGTTTESGPTNVATQYFAFGEVVADHGETSDLPDGIQAVLGAGAATVYGIVADVTAIVAEPAAGGVAAGDDTLVGTGILNPKGDVSVTVDDVSKTVVYSNVSPPANPGAGFVALNTDTREWVAGDNPSGAGTGVLFTYEDIDFTALTDALSTVDYEIILPSESAVSLKWLGLEKAIMAHVDANTRIHPFAMASSATVAATHDVTPLIASRHLYGVAHKSSDDVGCVTAGVMAVRKPWVTMFWKRPIGVGQLTHYSDAEVGSRGVADTFEGGDNSNLGPINVIIPVAGTLVLSNGLTTDGMGGQFGGWLDVTRTRNWLVAKVSAALAQLRLATEKIPFTDAGLNAVRDAIEGELRSAVNLNALASYTLFIPKAENLLQADKVARRLSGIQIGAQLAGDIHSFNVLLNLTV